MKKITFIILIVLGFSWGMVGNAYSAAFEKAFYAESLGDPYNGNVMPGVEFNGAFYIGTWNGKTGTQVYRLEYDDNGNLIKDQVNEQIRLYRFLWIIKMVRVDGFGRGNINFTTTCMTVHKNQLYVGVWGLGSLQLWRTKPGVTRPETFSDWEQVAPVTKGYATTSLASDGEHLYTGVFTIDPLTQMIWSIHQQFPFLFKNAVRPQGCTIWRSTLGKGDWEQINHPSFRPDPLTGDDYNSDATVMNVVNGRLYVGTENGYFRNHNNLNVGTGTEVWSIALEDIPNKDAWRLESQYGFRSAADENSSFPVPENSYFIVPYKEKILVGIIPKNIYNKAEIRAYDPLTDDWELLETPESGDEFAYGNVYNGAVVVDDTLYVGFNHPNGAVVYSYNEDRDPQWVLENVPGFDVLLPRKHIYMVEYYNGRLLVGASTGASENGQCNVFIKNIE